MVKLCVLCGNVDAFAGVSVHLFPSHAGRRQLWVRFVENQGLRVNNNSKLCLRHFVPGTDYVPAQGLRQRLLNTAVPSIVQPLQDQIDENNMAVVEIQMDGVLMDVEVVDVELGDNNIEVVEVQMEEGYEMEVVQLPMDNNNMEVVEAQMDGDDNVEVIEVLLYEEDFHEEVLPEDVEIVNVLLADVAAELEFMDILDVIDPGVAVELPRIRGPLIDRPASVRHQLPEQDNIGLLNSICTHCAARHFASERRSMGHFTLCCNNNQMIIGEGPRQLQPVPETLTRLLVDDSAEARHYRAEIRRYNNTLAFAAFTSDLNHRRLPGRGPRVFTVHGQVYRRITNDVVRNDLRSPRNCELYFVESGEANRIRLQQQPNQDRLNDTVLTNLDTMLREINPFARAFRTMRGVWLEEQRMAAANPLEQPRRVTMHFVADPNNDPRRYNLPAGQMNEVAVVFVGENGQPPRNMDLVIYDSNPVNQQYRMQTLCYRSQHADPMLYPLIYPLGEHGWHAELAQEGGRRNAVRTRNTIREFSRHRLAIRYQGNNDREVDQMSLLHGAGFLLQQYVCDHYVRMEMNDLHYIETHQADLFTEAYQGLLDHINQQLNVEAVEPVGRRMILPSSFTGGPRYMKQGYQDAMAIVRKYGKPDLFITFTCNPRWPEIQSNLGNWSTASDRPELVARVFHEKLKQLLRDITVYRVFGNVDAFVYTVEFQKRGLPHAHILIILAEDSKLLTAEDVDDVVCADLPDPATNQRLFAAVTSHMIHGPCGRGINDHSPCMVDGVCLKKYPKAYSEETVYVSDGGYPTYRRPDNGLEIRVRGHTVGNEFVVPYNPFLLAKYDAHINVEVCSTVKSVKYLYKYVYKGHDMAAIEVMDRDEIQNYINARYVSAPEAVWRLFEYELHKMSHTVVRLPVHLEDYHTVYFAPGQVLERLQNAALARTQLTGFFELNVTDVNARQYLYQEIPLHYTWNKPNRRWNPRRRLMATETLSRMYAVNPLDRDRFHLRLLLLHKRGPQSFQDMRTVDGVVHPTYAAAAVALGLLEDDRALLACMAESAAVDTPAQLRYLLVTMLLYCEAADPLALYMASEEELRQDFLNRFEDVDRARAACLDAIRRLLRGHGKMLADYGLPLPDDALLEEDAGEGMYNLIDGIVRWALQLDNLNPEQRTVYDRVMAAVDDNRDVDKMFYVDGPGGTGKTTLYGCLIWSLRSMGKSVLSVAFTGIAATLMDGGMTVHSTFGLPFGTLNENSTSSITMQSRRAQRIREAALIVWDEVPMSPGLQLTVVDRLLKDVMQKPLLPFGGKPVLFAGDFRQILPVVRRGTRAAIVATSIRHHYLWDVFERFTLTQNMRANNDADFAAWLLELGSGRLPVVDGNANTVEIPRDMVCDVVDLIDFVYPQQMSLANVDEFARKIILCPRNEDCRQVNRTVLQRVLGATRTYVAIDTVVADDVDEEANYPTEFLNSLEPDGLPPYRLTLVVGSVVMLLRNLDPRRRLCNGTRLVVTELRRNNFKARLLADMGDAQDDIVVPRIPLTSSGEDDLPFSMRRVQFPVRLSFAMTINKSQGQTFDRVGLFLPSPVFTHGQLYVAFSRVRDSQSIKVGMYGDDNGRFVTKNIVYSDVL